MRNKTLLGFFRKPNNEQISSSLRLELIGKWPRIRMEHGWRMKFPLLTLRQSWLTLHPQLRVWHWGNKRKHYFVFVFVLSVGRLTSKRKQVREDWATHAASLSKLTNHLSVKGDRHRYKEGYSSQSSLPWGMGSKHFPLKTYKVKTTFLLPFGSYSLPSLAPSPQVTSTWISGSLYITSTWSPELWF